MFAKSNIEKFVNKLNEEEKINLLATLKMALFPYMQRKDAIGIVEQNKKALDENLIDELEKITNCVPNRVILDLGY